MKEWMSPSDAAQWMKTTKNHITVLAHRHQWRKIKIGREVAYHADDIENTYQERIKNEPQNPSPTRPI